MSSANLFLVLNSNPYLQGLANIYQSLVNYFGENIILLSLYTIGIFMYCVFIWNFYKKLSKMDLFKLNLDRYRFDHSRWVWFKKLVSIFLYLLEYCVLFPIYIILWFGIMTFFLFIIAKNIEVKNILLISMSLVTTIRMASYYKQELATDISKLIPFALMAILITDPYFFSVQRVFERLYEIPSLLDNIFEFMVFVFFIEGLFRFIYLINLSLKKRLPKKREDDTEDTLESEVHIE